MFFINYGYNCNIPNTIKSVNNIIYLPFSNFSNKVINNSKIDYNKKLLDPQIYLSILDINKCEKTCAKLASYPWFLVKDIPKFEDYSKIREWEKAVKGKVKEKWKGKEITNDEEIEKCCKNAIEFQIKISCSEIILPSPLVTERENEFAIQSNWLDKNINMAKELNVSNPLITSIIISDKVITDNIFKENEFLDIIVDQVSARPEISGVYIVVVQTENKHPFKTDKNIYKIYLYLCKAFCETGIKIIMTNFADLYGLVCLGNGASYIATGETQSLRKISFNSFVKERGGGAMPFYFSNKCITELNVDIDLNAIVRNKILNRIKDITPYSADLIKKLEENGKASDLVNWAPNRNNVSSSRKHFIYSINDFTNRITNLTDDIQRKNFVREWLQVAEMNYKYIKSKINQIEGKAPDIEKWIEIFDEINEE